MGKYKWAHPYDWFCDWIAKENDAAKLREYLRLFAVKLSGDEIQGLFEKEMDEDGYFEPFEEFTVKKIHAGQVRYKDGLKGRKGFVPAGFAVCCHGTPLVWKDWTSRGGRIAFEVFDLKLTAEEEAAYFNRYGFGKERVTVEFA